MISNEERGKLLGLLGRSQRTLAAAVAGAGAEEQNWRLHSEKWTILEYVEHLAVAEDELLALVRRTLETPAQPETPEQRKAREDQQRVLLAAPHKNQAPASMQPHGRYRRLEAAMAAFDAAHERTTEFARTTQADLRSHFHSHAVFGAMDAFQWLAGIGRHAESHAAHIKEIRAAWGARDS